MQIILIYIFLVLIIFMAIRHIIKFNKTIYLKTIDNNFRFFNGENKFE